MRLLTIETATPLETVALVEGREVLGCGTTRAGRGRSDQLMALVERTFAETSLGLADLDGIAVSIGPGRFTGLRVGLATAKGLAAATGLPVFPVATLEALALTATDRGLDEAALVAPMLDARRGEVYAALFDGARGLHRVADDVAADPVAFATEAAGRAAGRPVLFAGTGALLYRQQIESAVSGPAPLVDGDVERPDPSAMAALAERNSLDGAPELSSLRPVYLRGV